MEIAKPGILDNLTFRTVERRRPGPGAVEVRVHAAGLNFQDAMLALGILPPESASNGSVKLGWDCAGIVSAVGEGVETLKVGDPVVGIARGCFARYATTQAGLMVSKPPTLTFEQSATIPVAFMTAYHGLCNLARLQKDERVLIHAAAGGVGLAAVQIAQHIGAEIFATAGSEEKRTFLRSLGVQHVMDSRSLRFVDEIKAETRGIGIDVILNSLAGEFIPKSLSILSSHGRFVEIGKVDILQNRPIGLRLFQNNIAFFALDYSQIIFSQVRRFNTAFTDVIQLFESGVFKPIHHQLFGPAEVVTAFRRLATGQQIGKAVIAIEGQEVPLEAALPMRQLLNENSTYLITGGLGGIGLAVARWMVQRSARHLVLVGRSAASEEATRAIDEMRKAGAVVSVVQADVADAGEMEQVVRRVRHAGPPLRGVVHAAAVLDDRTVLQLDRDRFDVVMRPKVAGAWNLHSLTLEENLDFFVLFSSAASVLGAPGQANYSGANAFLDAIAHYRQRHGLPAVSINWGPWSDIGLAARAGRGDRLAARGLTGIRPKQGLDAMASVLRSNVTQVSVLSLDPRQWFEFYPHAAGMSFFAKLTVEASCSVGKGHSTAGRTAISRAALHGLDLPQRAQQLQNYLRSQVQRILGFAAVNAAAIDVATPLNRLGIDSLMATELKNVIAAELGVKIPIVTFLKGASLGDLANHIAEHLNAGTAEDSHKAKELLEHVEEFSEEEIDALLEQRLARKMRAQDPRDVRP